MVPIPRTDIIRYLAVLKDEGIPCADHGKHLKWVRYYLDFCQKYAVSGTGSERLNQFIGKLRDKNQDGEHCRQAARAVALYVAMQGEEGGVESNVQAPASPMKSATPALQPPPLRVS